MRLALLPCAAACGLGSPALAQPVDAQLTRLYTAKQWAQALPLVEAQLARKPDDVQAQIQKGVVLTNLKRHADALAVFRKVTTEHPTLPGPHNNLAVLLAAKGDFEAARESLERAIRAQPGHATAYENLGDLHTHMAALAYGKALQVGKPAASAGPALALVDDAMPPLAAPSAPQPAAKTRPPAR
jgi:Flp pilus assembly protein TadD